MTDTAVPIPTICAKGTMRPAVADVVRQWNQAMTATLQLLDEHDDLSGEEASALFDVPLVVCACIYAMAMAGEEGETEDIVARFAAALTEQVAQAGTAMKEPGALIQ